MTALKHETNDLAKLWTVRDVKTQREQLARQTVSVMVKLAESHMRLKLSPLRHFKIGFCNEDMFTNGRQSVRLSPCAVYMAVEIPDSTGQRGGRSRCRVMLGAFLCGF